MWDCPVVRLPSDGLTYFGAGWFFCFFFFAPGTIKSSVYLFLTICGSSIN